MKHNDKFQNNFHGKNPYNLGKKYPEIWFSKMEALCIYYFRKQLTELEIAKLLNISSSTVCFYLMNIQIKLYTKDKIELLNLLKKCKTRWVREKIEWSIPT
ncbi:MAG: LuxR C-terminal-related transcriptional regulator [Gammaproteobacteria bacterium]